MDAFIDMALSLCREGQLLSSDLVVRLDGARLVVLSLARPFGKPRGQTGYRQCHDYDSPRTWEHDSELSEII